ncbi:MAG TPA: hypothetical protein VIB07_00940 [Nitrososphaera sp.]
MLGVLGMLALLVLAMSSSQGQAMIQMAGSGGMSTFSDPASMQSQNAVGCFVMQGNCG